MCIYFFSLDIISILDDAKKNNNYLESQQSDKPVKKRTSPSRLAKQDIEAILFAKKLTHTTI